MTTATPMRADAVRTGDLLALSDRAEHVADVQHGYRTPANLPAVCLVLEHTGRVIFPAAESVSVVPGVTMSHAQWAILGDAAHMGAGYWDNMRESLEERAEDHYTGVDTDSAEQIADLTERAAHIRALVAVIGEQAAR